MLQYTTQYVLRIIHQTRVERITPRDMHVYIAGYDWGEIPRVRRVKEREGYMHLLVFTDSEYINKKKIQQKQLYLYMIRT
jgi:hypothetical protein